MLLYVVVAFGLIVVWQLAGISQQLASNHSAMRELQGIGEKITNELNWYKDNTFAANLNEELRWYRDGTFANELRECLQAIPTDITGEIQTAAKNILDTLSTIENNTSHD